ncbi:MAG: YjbQ family protein, partial [Myxococcales bacterium]|nr:YjbQ family protein [Myxococcales bacterium]
MVLSDDLSIATRGRGTRDITGAVAEIVARAGVDAGVCTVFVHHTSASLIIGENADPDVQRDLDAFFA